jgi:hypothetical protein
MDCAEFRELMRTGELESTLGNPEWEDHGDTCPDCQKWIERTSLPEDHPDRVAVADTLRKAYAESRIKVPKSLIN